jgi:insulysin
METFVRDAPKMEERFASLKESVLERLRNPYENMTGKNKMLNMLAFEENEDFDLVPERIRTLESFTFQDLMEFTEKTLGRGNKNRLAVLLQGNDPENIAFSYDGVESAEVYKARL